MEILKRKDISKLAQIGVLDRIQVASEYGGDFRDYVPLNFRPFDDMVRTSQQRRGWEVAQPKDFDLPWIEIERQQNQELEQLLNDESGPKIPIFLIKTADLPQQLKYLNTEFHPFALYRATGIDNNFFGYTRFTFKQIGRENHRWIIHPPTIEQWNYLRECAESRVNYSYINDERDFGLSQTVMGSLNYHLGDITIVEAAKRLQTQCRTLVFVPSLRDMVAR